MLIEHPLAMRFHTKIYSTAFCRNYVDGDRMASRDGWISQGLTNLPHFDATNPE